MLRFNLPQQFHELWCLVVLFVRGGDKDLIFGFPSSHTSNWWVDYNENRSDYSERCSLNAIPVLQRNDVTAFALPSTTTNKQQDATRLNANGREIAFVVGVQNRFLLSHTRRFTIKTSSNFLLQPCCKWNYQPLTHIGPIHWLGNDSNYRSVTEFLTLWTFE